MSQLQKHNAFKEIIPKESLNEEDKQKFLGTIENAKLCMEVFDLFSSKHIETNLKIISTLSDGNKKSKQ